MMMMNRQQQQVWPVDYDPAPSQRLVEAAQRGDVRAVAELLGDPAVDVNYAGAVCVKVRRAEAVLQEEAPDEVRVEYQELRTDVSALFLAAQEGNLALLRLLLQAGADVNQKLFRGYSTTAAAREGRADTLEVLLKAGACQPACEEALLEAASHGRAPLAELLMRSDLIRPHIAVHALVSACSRGFVDVVDTFIKCGIDASAMDRVLLRSLKPALHTNADCTALVAAIVSRQADVVRLLLQAGVRKDMKVSLGAWSWDMATGEEFRVGAGLAEPYDPAWCAVEYFESTGSVLRMLLSHFSPNTLHYGRNLLHHAILCSNTGAISSLLAMGADCEFPVRTTKKNEFRPIHMAARLGHTSILQKLVDAGCDLNSRTDTGETAMMLCAKYKCDRCLGLLVSAGADLGLISNAGASASLVAASNRWSTGFQRAILDVVQSGKVPRSSNLSIFSPLMFVVRCGDVRVLEVLLMQPSIDIDGQDERGFSALMVAAKESHVDAFRLLVFAGANVNLSNNAGETALTLSQSNSGCSDQFEQVMLDFALQKGSAGGFYTLHFAARRGDLAAARLLTARGCDLNLLDSDGYTPLMLAAREGHGAMCGLLIMSGAQCHYKNHRGETALSLARKNGEFGNKAATLIADELARVLVLAGAGVKKHRKRGKWKPHKKELRMVEAAGVLRWGKSSRRNVVVREAEVGGSSAFLRNRSKKGDAYEAGVFRVVTTKGKEFHFICNGGDEMAELWVRGIRLVTRLAFAAYGIDAKSPRSRPDGVDRLGGQWCFGMALISGNVESEKVRM